MMALGYLVRVGAWCALLGCGAARDEEKIMKACYWAHEVYDACSGGCAEVTCDNPRNHLRPCYPYCEPGCVCEDPYVRDDRTHQCVLPQDCSPTQMGIPVPTKHIPTQPPPKHHRRLHTKQWEEAAPAPALEFSDVDGVRQSQDSQKGNDHQDKRNDMSRMGNYFNIVIAPPPIKSIHSRKLLDKRIKDE